MFSPIFVVDIKIIYGYNFIAPLRSEKGHVWKESGVTTLKISVLKHIYKNPIARWLKIYQVTKHATV